MIVLNKVRFLLLFVYFFTLVIDFSFKEEKRCLGFHLLVQFLQHVYCLFSFTMLQFISHVLSHQRQNLGLSHQLLHKKKKKKECQIMTLWGSVFREQREFLCQSPTH